MNLTITLPIAPSSNNAYTNGKGHGRRVLTTEGRTYKFEAIMHLRAAVKGQRMPDGARVAVSIAILFPDHRRTDIENRLKLLTDSIATALGFDDSAIDDLHIRRAGIDKQNPRCEVEVRTL